MVQPAQNFGGGAKLYRLVQWRTQDSVKGGEGQPGVREQNSQPPETKGSRHKFLGFLQEKYSF